MWQHQFWSNLQQTYLDTQSKARDGQGIESTDFGETRTPFQLQILARVQSLEVSDMWSHWSESVWHVIPMIKNCQLKN